MSDPLTTEDLYGKSPSPNEGSKIEPILEYEETPIIEPAATTSTETAHAGDVSEKATTAQLNAPHSLPEHATVGKKSTSHTSQLFTTIIAFILLFLAGIWLSSSFRGLLPSNIGDAIGLSSATKTPTPTSIPKNGNPAVPTTPSTTQAWKSYQVTSGVTKKPLDGVLFWLPSNVLSPVCDGIGCASQGSYLPGGTRFTVAARGVGQSLRDYRGTVISDVNGTTFTTKTVTIAGRQAQEFIGTFTGRTISGYAFTSMRGVMIPLTDTTSIELNHFIPSGITADFAKDDVLFDEILSKLDLSAGSVQKGSVIPSLTPTAALLKTASPTATITTTKTPTPTIIK